MTEEQLVKLDSLYAKAIQGKMSKPEESGDGKCARMGIEDDGYEDFRLEIDTDDCDKKKALASAAFMRELWNAWLEIRKSITITKPNPNTQND